MEIGILNVTLVNFTLLQIEKPYVIKGRVESFERKRENTTPTSTTCLNVITMSRFIGIPGQKALTI